MKVKPTWKWLLYAAGIFAFLTMLYTCALPGSLAVGRDNVSDLGGIFTVNGVDPTGAEYSGTVVIRPTTEADHYTLEWIVTGHVQQGTGQRLGNRFDVQWESVSSPLGAVKGTGTYDIQPDGRLTGAWSIDGYDKPGTEEIFPQA